MIESFRASSALYQAKSCVRTSLTSDVEDSTWSGTTGAGVPLPALRTSGAEQGSPSSTQRAHFSAGQFRSTGSH